MNPFNLNVEDAVEALERSHQGELKANCEDVVRDRARAILGRDADRLQITVGDLTGKRSSTHISGPDDLVKRLEDGLAEVG